MSGVELPWGMCGTAYLGRVDLPAIGRECVPTDGAGYVYFLMNSREEVIYVGQSYNPRKRLEQHKRKPWWRVVKWVRVWRDEASAINEFEAWQIRKLQPQYNRQFTHTDAPMTPELMELASYINWNPEFIRCTANNGVFAGTAHWMTCEHKLDRLCGDPECERAAATHLLELFQEQDAMP